VRGELNTYRRNGPARTTQRLLDVLLATDVTGATVLDIGGGVGAIQHALLVAGAQSAVGIDASHAYLEAAREEAERRGHADRMTGQFGDFVQLAPGVEPADIVTLDRVICCYDDMESLVRESAARARRFYGLIFPRDDWWLQLVRVPFNAFFRLRGNPYRLFIHPTHGVDALARAAGLTLQHHSYAGMWQIMLYTRDDAASKN
jgi:magnesium-protoporphyrin O-methyltransferase